MDRNKSKKERKNRGRGTEDTTASSGTEPSTTRPSELRSPTESVRFPKRSRRPTVTASPEALSTPRIRVDSTAGDLDPDRQASVTITTPEQQVQDIAPVHKRLVSSRDLQRTVSTETCLDVQEREQDRGKPPQGNEAVLPRKTMFEDTGERPRNASRTRDGSQGSLQAKEKNDEGISSLKYAPQWAVQKGQPNSGKEAQATEGGTTAGENSGQLNEDYGAPSAIVTLPTEDTRPLQLLRGATEFGNQSGIPGPSQDWEGKRKVTLLVIAPLIGIGITVLFIMASKHFFYSNEHIEVHVPDYGTVRGVAFTVEERSVFAFSGVSFADSTAGEHRFRAPVPTGRFTKVIDATVRKPGCSQIPPVLFSLRSDLQGKSSEDCLHLNIWTPCTSVSKKGCRKTVVVFLFGIEFQIGDNNRYDGRYFSALGDVVLVVPNFRMGAFGFLNFDAPTFPGNLPLRDQQLAIQWILNHIEQFGGDRNNVVLMGSAAGAWSVGAHFLSSNPYWRKHFSRIILQSESPFRRYFDHNATMIADRLGCPVTPTTDLIQCLQNVPAQNLVDLGRSFKLYFGPSYGTVPLLEPPWILARTTDINKKDVLIGSTSSEACVLLATISVEVGQGTESVRNAVNMIFDAYKIDRADEGGKLLSRYGRDGTNMSWVYDMVADMIYDCPVLSFAQYLASRGNHVRTYVFDHKATFSTFNTCIGAPRFQELDFVFGTPIHNASLDGTAAEVILSRKMIEMWAGFAKTGSLPNIRQDPWPYFTVAEQQHVRITTGPLEIISDYKKHTCKTMSDVMEELNSWQTHQ